MARRPKIDGLPAELKTQLERLLLDKTHGGYMVLSAWLKDQGFEISHAAVHRYDQRLQNVMSRIKASTEAARLAGPTGAPRLVAERSENGHADRFWAIALGTAAAHQPRVPIEFKSAGKRVAAGLPYNSNWEGFHG